MTTAFLDGKVHTENPSPSQSLWDQFYLASFNKFVAHTVARELLECSDEQRAAALDLMAAQCATVADAMMKLRTERVAAARQDVRTLWERSQKRHQATGDAP